MATSPLVQKLTGVIDLKKILDTTVKDLSQMFRAEMCQVTLSNPLDPNVTSICEFRPGDEPPEMLPVVSMPLVLHGRTLGSVSLARRHDMHPEELNILRVVLGELSDIIRVAQINDIVQRDTFHDTFLVEIANVMAYSLGVGDALFMVVQILGQKLKASRCVFICTEDAQVGWKCYEFWHKVQSCQDLRWPTTSSVVVAQSLLSQQPLLVYEGQNNSYVSPVQDELQLIGAKSLLSVALRSPDTTHGCVILQQCDYRRAWTRAEIDIVQNVADKVAEQLDKLPPEKRAREPIMQLHQRIVTPPAESGAPVAVSVRNALKGALGAQAIPTASLGGSKPAPPKPVVAPPTPKPAAAPTPTPPPAQPQPDAAPPAVPPSQPTPASAQNFAPPTSSQTGTPTISPVQSKSSTGNQSFAPPAAGAAPNKSLGSILGAVRDANSNAPAAPAAPTGTPPAKAAGGPAARGKDGGADPYADLDFGDFSDLPSDSAESPPRPRQRRTAGDPNSTWGNLDVMPQGTPAASDPLHAAGAQSQFETLPPGSIGEQLIAAKSAQSAPQAAPAAAAAPAPAAAATASATAAPTAGAAVAKAGDWGDLDSIPTPKSTAAAAPAPAGAWGDLDAIPTPAGAPKGGGLSSMIGKARASAASNPFSKARGAVAPPPVEAPPKPPEPSVGQLSDADAEARLKATLAAKSKDDMSDYVFATPGLDPRMAGRVSAWIQEIEEKDRYTEGHARQVAELSVAIAQEAGLTGKDTDVVRLAALLHDVGKRACPPQILQKRDEDLTDPELIVMMKHPLDGAELLESFPDLKHLADIVRSHHEEFDGNGYPQGLKGDEIPVAARIIAVANSYHSLTSKMVYGEGLPAEKAQAQLVKGAGKQWDPNFVQALVQAIINKKVPAAF